MASSTTSAELPFASAAARSRLARTSTKQCSTTAVNNSSLFGNKR